MTAVRREAFMWSVGVLESVGRAESVHYSTTPLLQSSVLPPHVARQNIELGAIFRPRPRFAPSSSVSIARNPFRKSHAAAKQSDEQCWKWFVGVDESILSGTFRSGSCRECNPLLRFHSHPAP